MLNEPSPSEDGRKTAQRIELGPEHDVALSAPRVIQERRDVERDVLRQIQPQQRSRHILEKRPHDVSLSVIDGEVTAVPRQARAHVANNRGVHVEAPVAAQPKAKAEIDVLEIAEILLVEAADLIERVTTIQGGSRTRRKDLDVNSRPLRAAHPVAVAPGAARHVITIARSVEVFRRRLQQHPAREGCRGRLPLRGLLPRIDSWCRIDGDPREVRDCLQ